MNFLLIFAKCMHFRQNEYFLDCFNKLFLIK